MNVCFVCYGNICRSPTAEIVFYGLVKEAGLSEQIRVTSGGIGAMSGESIDSESAATLRRHGYTDLTHSARRFGAHWFDNCDLVLASDERVADYLRAVARNENEHQRVRLMADEDIPNPWRSTAEDYEVVYEIIERACRDLLAELRGDDSVA